MDQWRYFAPTSILPATWTDGIEILLSNYVSPSFRVVPSGSASVSLAAGPHDQAVAISIRGKPRWVEAQIGPIAHPGGTAGYYDIYATTGPDSFTTSAPPPPLYEADATNHAFSLKIGTPSGTGLETWSRKVGFCFWDGTKIVGVWSTVGAWASQIPVVTSLPKLTNAPAALLSSGDLVIDYFVDSTATWRLQYIGSPASVWAFLGGPWWAGSLVEGADTINTDAQHDYVLPLTEAGVVPPLNGIYETYQTVTMGGFTSSNVLLVALYENASESYDVLQRTSASPSGDLTMSQIIHDAGGPPLFPSHAMYANWSDTTAFTVRQRELAIRPRLIYPA